MLEQSHVDCTNTTIDVTRAKKCTAHVSQACTGPLDKQERFNMKTLLIFRMDNSLGVLFRKGSFNSPGK